MDNGKTSLPSLGEFLLDVAKVTSIVGSAMLFLDAVANRKVTAAHWGIAFLLAINSYSALNITIRKTSPFHLAATDEVEIIEKQDYFVVINGR